MTGTLFAGLDLKFSYVRCRKTYLLPAKHQTVSRCRHRVLTWGTSWWICWQQAQQAPEEPEQKHSTQITSQYLIHTSKLGINVTRCVTSNIIISVTYNIQWEENVNLIPKVKPSLFSFKNSTHQFIRVYSLSHNVNQ